MNEDQVINQLSKTFLLMNSPSTFMDFSKDFILAIPECMSMGNQHWSNDQLCDIFDFPIKDKSLFFGAFYIAALAPSVKEFIFKLARAAFIDSVLSRFYH